MSTAPRHVIAQAASLDVLRLGLDVVFCGVNPGLVAAATGHAFAGRGNRFWRVLHRSGYVDRELDPSEGARLLEVGCGITAVVDRATAQAAELTAADFRESRENFREKMATYRPRMIAFLGKSALIGATGWREAAWGLQPDTFESSVAWLLPNPSGRNRRFSMADLVTAYASLHAYLRTSSTAV